MTEHVKLGEMLLARESRANKQSLLINKYRKPIICFTMNLAGDIKRSELSDIAFESGVLRIGEVLGSPDFMETEVKKTGSEAFFVYDGDPESIKQKCIEIEETHKAGRLFDIDVIASDGSKLSRGKRRKCIVCGGDVFECSRSRAHGLSAITDKTEAVLSAFAAEELADRAVEALINEAELTPKPGLVDAENSGAHDDMDLALLKKSARSLKRYFYGAALLGLRSKNSDDTESSKALKQMGINAEDDMFEASCGVNTHRGAVFMLGILLYAAGRSIISGSDIFDESKRISNNLLCLKSAEASSCTHGEEVKAKYGAGGAMEEAVLGFKTVKAVYEVMSDFGEHAALMYAISKCEDTNLLFRGGLAGFDFARKAAKDIFEGIASGKLGGKAAETAISALDDEFIERNLSPGGSADILAGAMFLKSIEEWVCGLR